MLSNAEVFSLSLSWARFHFLLKSMSKICKQFASAEETETCSGLSTVCQSLEEAVLTAGHTRESPVYWIAALTAELHEGAGWGWHEEGSRAGMASGNNEDPQLTLSWILIFLVIFLGSHWGTQEMNSIFCINKFHYLWITKFGGTMQVCFIHAYYVVFCTFV